jgi:integrase/recombinase XerD
METWIQEYLAHCAGKKGLGAATLKAYAIDLRQFLEYQREANGGLDGETVSRYMAHLDERCKPKSAKRKTASLKAFCAHLEKEGAIETNPFAKIRAKPQDAQTPPGTMQLDDIQSILRAAYQGLCQSGTPFQASAAIRDIAVLETLFATGAKISELCSLKPEDVGVAGGAVRIGGEGPNARTVTVGNEEARSALAMYKNAFAAKIEAGGHFFVNRLGNRLSEQSVRFMTRKYAQKAGIAARVTPRLFRSSLAALLLDEGADIRSVQQTLGHGSITTTQNYARAGNGKQTGVSPSMHPRNRIAIKPRGGDQWASAGT